MKKTKIKHFVLLFGFYLLTSWCLGYNLSDGYSLIQVKESQVEGIPRTNSIVATIDGHTLSIVFLDNLGQVHIEVEAVGGGETQYQSTPTPDGVDFYITYTGSYIVTFTLSNGDVYYGEFEVRD
ncbi:MAG: DUF3244 domain-containing protein [Bacteroidales bacterium]|nr:DUF3244 domain-containing protein [Bacteroidales bacterium]